MENGDSYNIYGVHNGLLLRTDNNVINDKIYSRNVPDVALKPNLNVRPVNTKTILYPALDARNKEKEENKNKYLDYYPEMIFAPINTKLPVNLRKDFLNTENELRGQNVPLHSGDLEKLNYIPSTDSTLYRMEIPKPSVVYEQPFPLLFNRQDFSKHLHINLMDNDIGKEILNNHTRQQLRKK